MESPEFEAVGGLFFRQRWGRAWKVARAGGEGAAAKALILTEWTIGNIKRNVAGVASTQHSLVRHFQPCHGVNALRPNQAPSM